MAAPRLNSRERADVYRRIFLVNHSFDLIVQQLDELARTRIFSAHHLREMSGLAQEVQLEINTLLLNPLESAELRDHAQFGKVRQAMEKRLRGKIANGPHVTNHEFFFFRTNFCRFFFAFPITGSPDASRLAVDDPITRLSCPSIRAHLRKVCG